MTTPFSHTTASPGASSTAERAAGTAVSGESAQVSARSTDRGSGPAREPAGAGNPPARPARSADGTPPASRAGSHDRGSSPAPGERAAPGMSIGGRYSLRTAIGHGGMGTVWRANDTLLRRDVAVKEVLLPPNLAPSDRDQMYQRTLREARAAAALSHPAVVQVYDVVTEAGRPWIVMELLQARSLSELIVQDGPLAPRAVAKIGLALLGALEVAHAASVLHRDVKPANVLICADGRCVLTDFGVARMPADSELTTPGMVLGSPHFISPERAVGAAFGPPSDLFSLGVTLYTAVEGHPPFDKRDAFETMRAVVEDDPSPAVRAGALAGVLYGLLEKDPDRRWDINTARRVLRDLLAAALASSAPAHETDPYAVVRPKSVAPPAPPASKIGGRAMLPPGEPVAGAIRRRQREQSAAAPAQRRPADPTAAESGGWSAESDAETTTWGAKSARSADSGARHGDPDPDQDQGARSGEPDLGGRHGGPDGGSRRGESRDGGGRRRGAQADPDRERNIDIPTSAAIPISPPVEPPAHPRAERAVVVPLQPGRRPDGSRHAARHTGEPTDHAGPPGAAADPWHGGVAAPDRRGRPVPDPSGPERTESWHAVPADDDATTGWTSPDTAAGWHPPTAWHPDSPGGRGSRRRGARRLSRRDGNAIGATAADFGANAVEFGRRGATAIQSAPSRVRVAALVGAVVLLVAVGAGAFFSLNGPDQTPQPTNSAPRKVEPTFPVVAYHDDRGITVSVPADWKSNQVSTYVDFTEPGDTGRRIRVNIETASGTPRAFLEKAEGFLKTRAQSCAAPYTRVNLHEDGVVLSNRPAAELEYTCGSGPQARHALWRAVIVDGKAYHFFLTVPDDQFAKSRAIYEELTRTFKVG